MEPSLLSGLFSLRGVLVFPFLLTFYQISQYIYNVFLHPLRKFPGPVLSAASTLPSINHSVKGDLTGWVCRLHEQYGDVVRITPNELSFSGADAFNDIYGHKKAGHPSLIKDERFYATPEGETRDMFNAHFADHARIRRIFSNAFSDRALKMQEPLFITYADKLVQKLREGIEQDPLRKVNIVHLYNFTTFDIMSDLTFGEPLNMLADASYHPWVSAMLAGFRFSIYLHAIRYFPMLESFLIRYCIPKSLIERRDLHMQFGASRVNRRLEKKDARPDIWGLVLERDDTSGLSRAEMYSNANLFMVAGTETTATLLSGLTYYLLSHPGKMQKLVDEIRSAFQTEKDITIEKLQSMKYLHACLEEGLRMYPPVPAGLPRITRATTKIDGKEVPAGASVAVTALAAFRNPYNFRSPNEFIPERWLPNSQLYSQDKKQGFQPFSTGPRGCIGKNMAYHEMRLILTKVLFNFDLTLCEESQDWTDQPIFLVWSKKPLYCKLKVVNHN